MLSGVYVMEPAVLKDKRGCFIKTFHGSEFKSKGLEYNFGESFYSYSVKNVIRGMHFQYPPHDCTKLIYVVCGAICDVILDIRKNSATYGQCLAIDISQKNKKSVYIPKGFAHGFSVLSREATVIYMQSAEYSSKYDAGIKWDSFGFDWNIKKPIISKRDKSFPSLKDFKSPFLFKDKS